MPETQKEEPNREEPNEVLVAVFASEQESEVMVVRSLLESAGIEVLTLNLDAPQDILPGVGGVSLRVREEDAEEARAIIAEYQNKGLTEAEAES
jgi:Putative prokaryotic signal transducing protein